MEPTELASSSNCNGHDGFEAAGKALKHLASIDLIQLCNEAKVERCRAIRGLPSCGRYVYHVLNSCGHASLCNECCQSSDICPICRAPVPKINDRPQLRLYYECIEAGLISRLNDDRFREGENGEDQIIDDVQRLHSLFDVALENNLVSLICHYVTDVCMDDSAVSSDPVTAILLDEVVVKDWCKRRFKIIVSELQQIYKSTIEKMKSALDLLLKCSAHLGGILNVLEILDSSFMGTVSGQPHDLHHLQEKVLMTKQHLEIIMWCARHGFLKNVMSRYADFSSWCLVFHERKSAAIKRSWPNSVNHSADFTRQQGSLFIEDALSNLNTEPTYAQELEEELDVISLQKYYSSSVFSSVVDDMVGCYPFKDVQAAADILFLHGGSDLVVAKQAIFIYYLFDRHWTVPHENWSYILDDFAATFGIGRHSVLESFTFYLLDDHMDDALQEACRILLEICGPTTHPKIAEVLLERQSPEAALMVLRWSGRDGAQYVPLVEAVTAVRVRVECGLLTEAFMYQRSLWMKMKERKLMHLPSAHATDDFKDECRAWNDWVEALVTEICCLCVRRNLVDQMIELPWNCDEETYLHKCLLQCAKEDPSATAGSLLVVFYLQRYRYSEAYHADCLLKDIEHNFISKASETEEVLSAIALASKWRTALVEKSLKLLPEIQQQQARSGKFTKIDDRLDEAGRPALPDILRSPEPSSAGLLVPSSAVTGIDQRAPFLKPSSSEIPSKQVGPVKNIIFEPDSHVSPFILRDRLFTNSERGQIPESVISKSSRSARGTPFSRSPLSHFNRSSCRVLGGNSHLQDYENNKILADAEQADAPYHVSMVDPATIINGDYGSSKILSPESYPMTSNKRRASDRPDKSGNIASSEIPTKHGENGSSLGDRGERWRWDESSDDEVKQFVEKSAFNSTPMRRPLKSRFARR